MSLLGEGEGSRGGGVQEWRATARIQQPQGGDGLHRGTWHTPDFAVIARSKDTVGQGKNCAEIFLLCSVYILPIEAFYH